MEINAYLLLAFVFALLVIVYLITKLWRVRTQLSFIKNATDDIKSGNLNRRILTRESDMAKQVCYDINEIAMNGQLQLIQQKQSEQAYKRLMTSLSHDVKTPLASLVGYLDAVEHNIVSGEEKEEYIHVAYEKAQNLKHFVEALFEWVKLDSKEQVFHFEHCDINELTRNIIADWVPILENNHFEYEIDIPETEYIIRIDPNAYTRILNNLLQNAVSHSEGNKVILQIAEDDIQTRLMISDNGKGILPEDLPHIFERMYQADQSRSVRGNGLGLSITQELVTAHQGTIIADSVPGSGAAFTIIFPKVL